MQKYNAGALVVYHGKSAQVSAVSADKIEIRIEGGASKSVRAKDIEFLHPGPVSSLPPRALPEPDCCEIMELMEGETFPFSEFAELLYSENTPASFWAAYQLLSQGIYFTGSPADGVKARPKEEIEAELAANKAKWEAYTRRRRQDRQFALEQARRRREIAALVEAELSEQLDTPVKFKKIAYEDE